MFAITHHPESVLFFIFLILKWYCYEHACKYYGGALFIKVDVDAHLVTWPVEIKNNLIIIIQPLIFKLLLLQIWLT